MRGCALFLDIDGTLFDIAASPDAVRVPPCLPALLSAVSDRLDGALALVSGRCVDDIDRLFAPRVFAASGQHGAEFRPHPRDAVAMLPYATPIDAGIRRALAAIANEMPGVLLEDKGVSIAVHYRAAPVLREPLREKIAAAIAAHGPAVRLLGGRMVWEVLPAGLDKGVALECFMRLPPYAGRLPVFIGDDVTDEDGFRSAIRLGGQALRVGRNDEDAFSGPDAVRTWLAGVAAALGEAA